jgi:hypothetical protein
MRIVNWSEYRSLPLWTFSILFHSFSMSRRGVVPQWFTKFTKFLCTCFLIQFQLGMRATCWVLYTTKCCTCNLWTHSLTWISNVIVMVIQISNSDCFNSCSHRCVLFAFRFEIQIGLWWISEKFDSSSSNSVPHEWVWNVSLHVPYW